MSAERSPRTPIADSDLVSSAAANASGWFFNQLRDLLSSAPSSSIVCLSSASTSASSAASTAASSTAEATAAHAMASSTAGCSRSGSAAKSGATKSVAARTKARTRGHTPITNVVSTAAQTRAHAGTGSSDARTAAGTTTGSRARTESGSATRTIGGTGSAGTITRSDISSCSATGSIACSSGNSSSTAETCSTTGTVSSAGRLLSSAAAVLVSCVPISVRSAAAMLRIVLPFSAVLATVGIVGVDSVEIVFVVNGDVAVAPIAIAPIVCPRCSQYESCAKCQPRSRHVAWIIIGRIRITPRWTVNDRWIIRRNIDELRVGRLNYDSLLPSLYRLSFHFLLLGCL